MNLKNKNLFSRFSLVVLLLTLSFFLASCGGMGFDGDGSGDGPGGKPPTPGGPGIQGKAVFESLPLENISLECKQGSDSVTVETGSDGYYFIGSLSNGTYTIIPSKKGWIFSPSSYTVTYSGGNINGYDFSGSAAGGYRTDSWGGVWDDTMRPKANLANACATCESLGGRLPTPTEIFRNSSNGHGSHIVGTETTYLWTNIEYSATQNVTVRMSDGATSQTTNTSSIQYRCYYPDKDRSYFYGRSVYGPPGEEAFTLTSNGVTYYMDKYDRPLLRYNSAVREAAFYHASVPPQRTYTEAIKSGLPNGLNLETWTSDQEGKSEKGYLNGVVKWSGTNPDYAETHSTFATWAYVTEKHRFRIVGIGRPVTVTSSGEPTEWIGTTSYLKSLTTDKSEANFYRAIDNCLTLGGHMPTFNDLMEMIQDGLPGGSENYIWTSDNGRGSSTSRQVGTARWSGIDTNYTGLYSTYGGWSNKADATLRPYRPVFYPVNDDYNGPDESVFKYDPFLYTMTNPNGKTVKIWADDHNRDAAPYHVAVKTCYDLGGHLPTFRDMVELIRNGLPNGTAPNRVWTSDSVRYDLAKTLAWGTGSPDGTEPDFTEDADVHNTRDTSTELCYRCIWTNEMRIH
ncbi:MAG: hypothetical protein GY754_09160 [bacterium]|nr:hypothetical protein [bacterium]